jgi:hypothetical protein
MEDDSRLRCRTLAPLRPRYREHVSASCRVFLRLNLLVLEFFSWGPHRKHGTEALRDTLMGIAGKAFTEDRTIIEAQQQVIDLTPSPRVMPTIADRAITLYNQLVATRIREEAESASSGMKPRVSV